MSAVVIIPPAGYNTRAFWTGMHLLICCKEVNRAFENRTECASLVTQHNVASSTGSCLRDLIPTPDGRVTVTGHLGHMLQHACCQQQQTNIYIEL